MLRDERGHGGGRQDTPRNVLGDRLEVCSINPMTGFFRDGCCDTGREDIGSHTVCAVMTAAFLAFSKSCGNDLSTPVPEFGFRGLKPGDRWCLCAPRWQEALAAGRAPRVVLRATPKEGAFAPAPVADLKRFAVALAWVGLPWSSPTSFSPWSASSVSSLSYGASAPAAIRSPVRYGCAGWWSWTVRSRKPIGR